MPLKNSSSDVFSPISIGNLRLSGKFIKSATSESRASADGKVTASFIEFYQPFCAGGTPLIITGNIYVSAGGKSTPFQLGADADDKIDGFKELTQMVHQSESKIFAQLSHCGRQVIPDSVGLKDVVSASDTKDLITGTKPRALKLIEISNIIDDFADAALRCKQGGFDGVQIHAGHGYLISQFLTPYTNRRDDKYGGSPQNRMEFLLEVYRAIRDKTGPDYPIIIKLNGADSLPLRAGLKTDELVDVARQLEIEGLDAVEISVGHYESGFPFVRGTFLRCLKGMVEGSVQFMPPTRRKLFGVFWPLIGLVSNIIWRRRAGFNLRYAKHFTEALNIPVICVGGFHTLHQMESAITGKLCDAVSVARSMIADPYLYRHLRSGRKGPECVFCNACIGNVGHKPIDCYHPVVGPQKQQLLRQQVQSTATDD